MMIVHIGMMHFMLSLFVMIMVRLVRIVVDHVMLVIFRMVGEGHHREVNIMMLNSMKRPVLHFMEKLVKLVLDLIHQMMTVMIVDVVIVVMIMVLVMKGEVSIIGVVGDVVVDFRTPNGMMVTLPVIRAMLNAMNVVVSINMLRVVLTRIFIGIVVAHMMSSLRLNIVVLTMFFSSEVTFVIKMRLMVLDVPVSLFEVSERMMLLTMHQNFSLVEVFRVRMFVGSDFG